MGRERSAASQAIRTSSRASFSIALCSSPATTSSTGSRLRLNEHIEADGPTVFDHACKMGLEGIVLKRKTSPYRSGRSPNWVKSKNPACEAVRREAEEDWESARISHRGSVTARLTE